MNEDAPPTGKRAAGLSKHRDGEVLPTPHVHCFAELGVRIRTAMRQPAYACRTSSIVLAHRSVAVAAPIEPVVDPRLHHLNVAVAPGEDVAGEEWGASGNNKCPILQP
jgi:hypothetical protein